jgi:hypothetical protein
MRKNLWALAFAVAVSGCAPMMPKQLHLTLITKPESPMSVDAIVSGVSSRLDMKVSTANFDLADGNRMRNFEIYKGSTSIFIQSAADQHCYSSKAAGHPAFHAGKYDVSLVQTSVLGPHIRFDVLESVIEQEAKRQAASITDVAQSC